MKLSFRWYGESDPISLEYIRQIPGMRSIVSAVYDVKPGEVWPEESIKKMKDAVEKSGNNVESTGYNFILMELADSNIEVFNKTLQEIFANTGKGVKIVGAMCDYIKKNREQDEFDDYIQQQNSKYPIEDGYFTAEELVRDFGTT